MGENSISAERIAWLDYAKVVGMFLVILGHCYPFHSPPSIIRNFIYLFHMPLFFWISGLFFKDISLGRLVRKNLLALIVPALCWMLIWTALLACCNHLSVVTLLKENALSLLKGKELSCGPAWFLFALFWCHLLQWGILRVRQKWVRFCAILIFVLVCKFTHYLYVGQALMALPYFSAAYFCSRWFLDKDHKPSIITICFFGSLLVMAAICYGPISISSTAFGNLWRTPVPCPFNIPVCYLVSFGGVLFFTLLFKRLEFKRNRWIESVSVGLIIFLCFHMVFLLSPIGRYFMEYLPDDNLKGFFARFVFSLMMMGLSWVVCKFVMRYKILAFLSGYRGRK